MAAKRIAYTEMFRGSYTRMITIDTNDYEGYVVGIADIYRTSQFGRVGGVFEKNFATEADARSWANGAWKRYRSQGWSR